MEADWEFEIGGDAPVIDALWPGLVDLQRDPERACELPEAVQLPGLAATLKKLNAQRSRVWTSKCDFWPALQPADFDPDELDAPSDCFAHAMGCYIDLLPKSNQLWPLPEMVAAACKQVCSLLGAVPLRCCRADLIIRRALIAPGQMDMGITAYLTSCGPSSAAAARTLESALAAFADALCPHSTLQ